MANLPEEFRGVTVQTKANVYFDGGVVSHTVLFSDGTKKTIGVIRPGKYHFCTDKAERMEIVGGVCRVKIDGASAERDFTQGAAFDVPAKSGFDIEVAGGLCEYICSFLD